jgi:hypothetical protein
MEIPSELVHFVDGEQRLRQWPAKRKIQLFALQYLATKFQLGVTYSERDANDLLNRWHTFGDGALLRRELFDNGFLERAKDGRQYWLAETAKE